MRLLTYAAIALVVLAVLIFRGLAEAAPPPERSCEIVKSSALAHDDGPLAGHVGWMIAATSEDLVIVQARHFDTRLLINPRGVAGMSAGAFVIAACSPADGVGDGPSLAAFVAPYVFGF